MVYSRYYRHKLTDKQKKIYDLLLRGLEDRKSEVQLFAFSVEDFHEVTQAMNLDNPHLYYVDFNKMTLQYSLISCTIRVVYLVDKTLHKEVESKLRKTVLNVLRDVMGKTVKQASLILHDWLVLHCKYGECERFPNAGHSIVGALLYGTCVCEGYAKAYKCLADQIKLRCLVAVGDAIHPNGRTGGHAWNIIKLDSQFYHIDVTFDLLIANEYISRAYYLLSTKEICLDHKMDEKIEFPACTQSGSVLKLVSGTSELLQFLENEFKSGAIHSEVRLSKGFLFEKLLEMIRNKVTPKDAYWHKQIKTYWYGDHSRTLLICWK